MIAQPPIAAGDSSGNIPINATRQAANVWVAKRNGTVVKLRFHIKTEGSQCRSGRTGYAAGTSGILRATTRPVNPDGTWGDPVAEEEFVPCERDAGETTYVNLNLPVAAGDAYVTVVRNADQFPGINWFSMNYLRSGTRLYPTSDYGLDPRERVLASFDAGVTWGAILWLPTYIAEYADGVKEGQEYYSASPASGTLEMYYRLAEAATITKIGGYFGTGTVTLEFWTDHVGGTVPDDQLRRRTSRTFTGPGMLRQAVSPVSLPAGAVVKIVAVDAPVGMLKSQYSDSVWDALLGHGTGYRWYLASIPTRAVPIYPLVT